MSQLESPYTRQLLCTQRCWCWRKDGKKSMLSENRTQNDVVVYLNREGPQDICCAIRLSIRI